MRRKSLNFNFRSPFLINLADTIDFFKKSRRSFIIKSQRNRSARKFKDRVNTVNFLLIKFFIYSLKNRNSLFFFRKFINNSTWLNLSISNSLRSANLHLRKLDLCNFLEKTNCFYT